MFANFHVKRNFEAFKHTIRSVGMSGARNGGEPGCLVHSFRAYNLTRNTAKMIKWNVCAPWCLHSFVYSTRSILFCFISLHKFNSFIPFAVFSSFLHILCVCASMSWAEMRYALLYCMRLLKPPQGTRRKFNQSTNCVGCCAVASPHRLIAKMWFDRNAKMHKRERERNNKLWMKNRFYERICKCECEWNLSAIFFFYLSGDAKATLSDYNIISNPSSTVLCLLLEMDFPLLFFETSCSYETLPLFCNQFSNEFSRWLSNLKINTLPM